MTLSEFMGLWTRKNLAVVLCNSYSYDDMFDVIDEMNDNDRAYMSDLEGIKEHIIGVIEPRYSDFIVDYYVRSKWVNAEVTNFFIGTSFVLVWIKVGDEE